MANYRDADDLAQGMYWVLEEADAEVLKSNCLQKVVHNYSQHAVAMNYIEVYNQAMAYKITVCRQQPLIKVETL